MAALILAGDAGRLLEDAAAISVDACTLNNALNVVQLAVLLAILRWVRSGA